MKAKDLLLQSFDEPNHTQAPNKFFEMLPDMGEAELRVTLVMIRQTFGYHRESFKMGISKLASAAGLTENGARNGAKAAEERGIFKRVNPESKKEAEWVLNVNPNHVDPQPTAPLTPTTLTSNPNHVDLIPSLKESIKQNIKENTADAVSEIVQSANKKVDAILEYEKEFSAHAKWQGRENVPPHLLQYADWWNSQTGQVMRGGKGNNEWFKAFTQWQKEELTIFNLQEAYNHIIAWKKIIARPSEITSAAIAIHALPKANETKVTERFKDGSGYV